MRIFIITLTLIMLSVTSLEAQILDRTENRAKQKANNRVDQKIDKGIDKGLDAIEGLFGKKNKKADRDEGDAESTVNNDDQTPPARTNPGIFGLMSGSVDVKDSYTFDSNVLLDIKTYDKKGKEESSNKMTMYFSKDEPHFGMEMHEQGTDAFILYDIEKYQMVTLMNQDGQNIGMAMQLNPENFQDADSKDVKTDVRFEKTGNTKTISGYHCEEYKVIDPEEKNTDTYMWTTDETDANWIEMMADMMATNKKMSQELVLPDAYPDGAIIQVINQDKNNGEKMVTTVEEINPNATKTISTKEYQMMALPSGKSK